MATQSPTDGLLPMWKVPGKQAKKDEDDKRPQATKISESTKPILEEQAILREKLKTFSTWRKDPSGSKRKSAPMLARPPSPNSSFVKPSNASFIPTPVQNFKPPSPPCSRPRTPNTSPLQSANLSHTPRSGSPTFEFLPEHKKKVEKVLRARLYLLQQTGPNSFLVGGDSPDHKFKVIIGTQSCSCGRGFCVHLLFVMLRVFKLKPHDPMLWSNNLKNFEVETLFRRFHNRLHLQRLRKTGRRKMNEGSSSQTPPPSPTPPCSSSSSSSSSTGSQGSKDDEDVCPICLLEMVEGESLTSCTKGCHNKLHQHCMEIWATECARLKERLNCPLCRKVWDDGDEEACLMTSPLTTQTRVPTPSLRQLGRGNDPMLPHSDPIPAEQVELARPWIEVFGENLISCLFSREWNIRETALKHLSRLVIDLLAPEEPVSQDNVPSIDSTLGSCCSVIAMMCGDPVYRVYVAALRCMRTMLTHTVCPSEEQITSLQNMLRPAMGAIINKCSDANRRISAVSIKTLQEVCLGQSGELAVGKAVQSADTLGLGGISYVLSCVLAPVPEYATWPWWLGRLYFLRHMLDDSPETFEPDDVMPQRQDANTPLTVNHPHSSLASSFDRLMAVLKFCVAALEISHSKGKKLAVRLLIVCIGIAAKSPAAFMQVKSLVAKVKPCLRSFLQRHTTCVQTEDDQEEDSHPVTRGRSGSSAPAPTPHNPSPVQTVQLLPTTSIGCSAECQQNEHLLSESQLLQSIVESLAAGGDAKDKLNLPMTPPLSPSKDGNLNWSREDDESDEAYSPRLPPARLKVTSKNNKLPADEEAEAIAIALATSVTLEPLPKIPQLIGDDVDVITVYAQPENETSDGGPDDRHVYLEGIHWKKGKLLGTGAFSSCYCARDVSTGALMAVKQVSFCRNTSSEQDKVVQTLFEEVALMAKLKHPHIVRCLGATKSAGHFNIFLEWLAGGSLASILSSFGPFDESVIIKYSRQILQAVACLHDHHIIHRDLKGANILVDATGHQIRIADFGASARLASKGTGAGEFKGQLLGTIAFMAPEVLRGESYGRSCDIWSVGCVLIEMATGKAPWNADQHSNHLALIFKIACATEPPEIPEHLSQQLRDLILRSLENSPENRETAVDLLRHTVFTKR